MNLENRIERLENRIGVGDEIPPLIRIDVVDSKKGSTDPGIPLFIVIPGQIGGFQGTTLFRAEDESPNDFLKRCEKKYSEFYA